MTHDELVMIVVAVRREQDRQKVEIGGLKACLVQLQDCVFGKLKLTPDVPSTTTGLRNLAADLARKAAPSARAVEIGEPAPDGLEESAEEQSGEATEAAISEELSGGERQPLSEVERRRKEAIANGLERRAVEFDGQAAELRRELAK